MAATATSPAIHAKISKGPGRTGLLIFGVVLIVGLASMALSAFLFWAFRRGLS